MRPLLSKTILFLMLITPSLHAQTVLLVSQESQNGTPLAPPLAVRDGVSASLYEEGFIVFDDNGDAPSTEASAVMSLARTAGAELILQVSTEFTGPAAGAALATITARTSFTLTSVERSGVIARGSLEATNKGREGAVDRAGLGMEIGRSITAQIVKALVASPS
jgi:hypothetical protein